MSHATRHSGLEGSLAQIRCASAMASSTDANMSNFVVERGMRLVVGEDGEEMSKALAGGVEANTTVKQGIIEKRTFMVEDGRWLRGVSKWYVRDDYYYMRRPRLLLKCVMNGERVHQQKHLRHSFSLMLMCVRTRMVEEWFSPDRIFRAKNARGCLLFKKIRRRNREVLLLNREVRLFVWFVENCERRAMKSAASPFDALLEGSTCAWQQDPPQLGDEARNSTQYSIT